MDKSKKKMSRSYDRAAFIYETMAHIYSLGGIRKSKLHGVAQMEPGEKVIFLGVGSGEEAILAAKKGLDVTCVDISQGMLDTVQQKLDKENLTANLICQDALTLEEFGKYDICAANYFLNVFLEDDMRKFLRHSAKLVRSGGKFLIADVAIPEGNLLNRTFNYCYLKWAMIMSWIVGLVPLHENYDYVEFFPESELEFQSAKKFRLLGGPVLFQSIVARKK